MGRLRRQSQYVFLIFIVGIVVGCHACEMTIALECNDSEVVCIATKAREYSRYCLAIRLEGRPLSGRAFSCSLEGHLVYECSSGRTCTAYGAMKNNVAPTVAAEGCSGLPFANFHSDLQGSYECLLDNSLSGASFQLSYCTEPKELLLELTRGGEEVGCVAPGQREQDDYCLEVKQDDGTPATAFECKLNGTLVYICRPSGDCEAYGAMKNNVATTVAAEGCSGLPFANFHSDLLGSYECHLDNSPSCASFQLSYCTESSPRPPGVAPEEEDKEATTIRFSYIYLSYAAFIVVLIAGLICHPIYNRRRRSTGHATIRTDQSDAIDVINKS